MQNVQCKMKNRISPILILHFALRVLHIAFLARLLRLLRVSVVNQSFG